MLSRATVTQITSQLPFRLQNRIVMDRRSLALILIVLLLVWSVNQPSAACPLMNSRAAAMVRAGASPASQPEPSPSRHTCCPDPKVRSAHLLRSSSGHCNLRPISDMPCCSISSQPAATSLPPVPAKAYLTKFVAARVNDPRSTKIQEVSIVLAFSAPGRIPMSLSPLLRL